ncbi:UNVERIFIED_CONTAM: Iron-sulfur assembly protein IscA-like 2, mitochondrial [Sesamum latifolium]|uniref:Iron-sulfur assembly protein IscA-like 2, mitochondrial n=1 Tax=Sesamum latifolium TaxID=2727402 RepID=A0AAW2TZE5_9LAMI
MTTSSRSLIRRFAPYFSARLRQNSRLLSSSSALQEPQPSSSESPLSSPDVVRMTDSCVRRMKELQVEEASQRLLRLSIEAGGCSGFQYNFSLDDKINDDDRIFEQDGVKLVVDNVSFDFVKGATVDYVEELIRSAFQPSILGLLKYLGIMSSGDGGNNCFVEFLYSSYISRTNICAYYLLLGSNG